MNNKKRIVLKICHEAKIEELIRIYNIILSHIRPSIMANESIFKILFQEKRHLQSKLVDLARVLIGYNIELCSKIINTCHQTICEIVSHKAYFRQKIVRVLYYLSEGEPGLTRMIIL